MNKKTVLLLVLMAIVAFSFTLFAPVYSQEGMATVTPTQPAEDTPIPAAQNTSVPSVSRDALLKYASADIETQTVNGIEMSASNFRVEGSFLEVDICVAAPDNREWMVGEGFVQTDSNKILLLGAKNLEMSRNLNNGIGQITIISDGNINIEKTNHSVPNYRCDTLQFVIGAGAMQFPATVSLTIKNIYAFPQGCTTEEAAQSILDEKDLGIKIACTYTGSDGLYSTEIQVLEKPQSMSEDEARQLIDEARRQAAFIDGPWVFEGTVTVVENP